MADSAAPAPLGRRLASAFYDFLLLFALWLATEMLLVVLGWASNRQIANALHFLVSFAFLGWFWTHGGQTPGMAAWRLRAQRVDGTALNWPTAAWRYAVAWPAWLLGGAGIWWTLTNPRRRGWQDLASGTELILLPPRGAQSQTDSAANPAK